MTKTPPEVQEKITGLAELPETQRPPLPPSAPGFVWPYGRAATKEQRRRIREHLIALCAARDWQAAHFAAYLFGGHRLPTGRVISKHRTTCAHWLGGAKGGMPKNQATAENVARLFGVSVESLLAPIATGGATLPDDPYARAKRGKGKGKGKSGASLVPYQKPAVIVTPAPVATLPANAKPIAFAVQTHPTDARFVDLSVAGTATYEQALSIMALLNPTPHR